MAKEKSEFLREPQLVKEAAPITLAHKQSLMRFELQRTEGFGQQPWTLSFGIAAVAEFA